MTSSLELRSEFGSGGGSANQVYLSVNSECKVARESEGKRDRRGTKQN